MIGKMAPTKPTFVRHYYIDYLRVFAILLVFLYHVFLIFAEDAHWNIENDQKSVLLREFNILITVFRMPLLFFVAGFITTAVLGKYPTLEFIRQRFVRLILPFILCTFIVVAPQIYYMRLFQGVTYGSYFEFFQTFITLERYPVGNFHWKHLWFIPYLFVYNMLSIPIYAWLKRILEKRKFMDFSGFPLVYGALAIIPLLIINVYFDQSINGKAFRHAQYFAFVIFGLSCACSPIVLENITRHRRRYLAAGVLLLAAVTIPRWYEFTPKEYYDNYNSQPLSYLFYSVYYFQTYIWLAAILGYAKRYLKEGGSKLKYANEAVYPFYILHMTIIVVIGYYVVATDLSLIAKVLAVVVPSFLIAMLLYELIISKVSVLRFIFGLRQKKKTGSVSSKPNG